MNRIRRLFAPTTTCQKSFQPCWSLANKRKERSRDRPLAHPWKAHPQSLLGRHFSRHSSTWKKWVCRSADCPTAGSMRAIKTRFCSVWWRRRVLIVLSRARSFLSKLIPHTKEWWHCEWEILWRRMKRQKWTNVWKINRNWRNRWWSYRWELDRVLVNLRRLDNKMHTIFSSTSSRCWTRTRTWPPCSISTRRSMSLNNNCRRWSHSRFNLKRRQWICYSQISRSSPICLKVLSAIRPNVLSVSSREATSTQKWWCPFPSSEMEHTYRQPWWSTTPVNNRSSASTRPLKRASSNSLALRRCPLPPNLTATSAK